MGGDPVPDRLLDAYEQLRPRGRYGPGDRLLDLACDDRGGRPRQSVRAYAYRWRCSWRQAERVLEAYDGKPVEGPAPAEKPSQDALPGLPQKPSRLLNLLPNSDVEGGPVGLDEKAAWWEHEGSLVEADAEAEAVVKGADTPRGQQVILKATALRYFKRYLMGARPFRGADEAVKLQNGAERYLSGQDDPSGLPAADRPSARLRQARL